ncbi:MAG: hypothetical protein LBS06_05575 [Treponema sp.]|jgi:hypothetical protein|nr:hypothetical protein [Treponema sp.]
MTPLSQANKENGQFNIKAYTKLMENYNVFPGQIATVNAQRMINDVCAGLDCRDTPVIIGSCTEGTMVQLTLDQKGDAGFIPKPLGLIGKMPAIGLASDRKCYLFALNDNKVWYAFESSPGSNKFGDANFLNLPYPVASSNPVRVFARNVGGKLCVGVVTDESGRYSLAYCGDFHFGSDLTFISETPADYDTYDFMRRGDGIYAVSVTGNQIRLTSVQDNSKTFYTFAAADQIAGLRWVPWTDNAGKFIALIRQGNDYAYGEIFLSGSSASLTVYENLPEQCSFEACSIIAADSAVVHMLFSGSKIYHSFLSNGEASLPIPIESGGGKAAFLETGLDRAEFYIADAAGNRILQICQNRAGDYTGRSLRVPWESDGGVSVTSCYSTELHLTDNNDAPLINQTFTVWAQDDIYIQCDTGTHRLGPRNNLTMCTDARGTATFIQQVDDMVSTVLCIRVPEYMSIDEVYYIRQYECVSNVLKNLTLQEFLDAKTNNGEYFLSPQYRNPTDAKKLLDTVQTILNMSPDMSNEPDAIGAYFSKDPGENGSGIMRPLEPGFVCSIAADGSLSRSGITPEEFEKLVENSIRSGAGEVTTSFGDLSRGIDNGLVRMDSLAISGTEIFIEFTIGNEAFSFGSFSFRGIISGMSQALEAVGSVFSSIGNTFKKCYDWLGFIFDWNDFKLMKNACDYMLLKTLPYLKRRCSEYKSTFDDKLAEMQTKCNQYLTDLNRKIGGVSIFTKGKQECPEDPRVSLEISNNILLQKTIQYIGQADIAIPQDVFASFTGDLQKVHDALKEYGLDISNSNEYKAIDAFLQKQYTSLDSLYKVAFSSLVDLLTALSNIAFDGFRCLSSMIIDVAGGIIDIMLTILKSPLNIPFVSWVYRKYYGEDLTALDVCSFLLGVVGTILYKLFYHKAPIASDSELGAFKQAIDDAVRVENRAGNLAHDIAIIVEFISLGTTIITGLVEMVFDGSSGAGESNGTGGLFRVEASAWVMLGVDCFSLVASSLVAVVDASLFGLVLVFDFLVLAGDYAISCIENKFITRVNWGTVVTAIIGVVRVILYIVLMALGLKPRDVIAGAAQGFHEIFKILLYFKDVVSISCVVACDLINTTIQCGAIIMDMFDGYQDNTGKDGGVPCLGTA